MTPCPTAISLVLCERLLIEEGTRRATLINTFSTLSFADFPSPPQTIYLFAVLTNGVGEGVLEAIITHLETDDETDHGYQTIELPDRLSEQRFMIQYDDLTFPAEGTYLFTLLVDGEWVAQRQLVVNRRVSE